MWDLRWTGEGVLAATTDQSQVEVWNTESGICETRLDGEGHGVEIAHGGGHTWVNVQRFRPGSQFPIRYSVVYLLTPSGLKKLREYECEVIVAASSGGTLLCQSFEVHDRSKPNHSEILSPEGDVLLRSGGDVSPLWGKSLRLDGDVAHYFLTGPRKGSEGGKRLVRIPPSGKTEVVMAWDVGGEVWVRSVARFVAEDSIIRCSKLYHPHPGKGAVVLERGDFRQGKKRAAKQRWRKHFGSAVSAMDVAGTWCACLLADGKLAIRDVDSGELLSEFALTLEGTATYGTAIAIQGGTLAVGTICGRILLYRVTTASE